jgi:hypothetical protein
MTAPTFDTHAAVRDLRSAGIEEPAAESIVEVVSAATSPLVTRDMLTTEIAGLRADMYRALWIQGAGIVAVVAGIIGITQAIA